MGERGVSVDHSTIFRWVQIYAPGIEKRLRWQWRRPFINTDKAPTYGAALAELKKADKCPEDKVHRDVKYLNSIVEADHGKLKHLIRPVRGFKTLKTAYATIRGCDVMRAFRKSQVGIFNITRDICGEARIVERVFGLGPSALAEAVEFVGEQLQLEAD